MRLRQSAVGILLLIPAGVLGAHGVGYAAAGHGHGVAMSAHSHRYLAIAAAVAALLAVIAVLAGMAGIGTKALSFRKLLVLQCSILLLQEGTEHLLARRSLTTLLLFQPLWLSLAAQVAAAGLTMVLLRWARAVGAALFSLPGRARGIALWSSAAVVHAVGRSPRPGLGRAVSARAPPAVAV